MATACEPQCRTGEVHEVELVAPRDEADVRLAVGLSTGRAAEGGQLARQPAFDVHGPSVRRGRPAGTVRQVPAGAVAGPSGPPTGGPDRRRLGCPAWYTEATQDRPGGGLRMRATDRASHRRHRLQRSCSRCILAAQEPRWARRSPITCQRILDAGVIRMSTDPAYPPQSELVDGVIVGFDIDVGTEIAKRLGVALQLETPDLGAHHGRLVGRSLGLQRGLHDDHVRAPGGPRLHAALLLHAGAAGGPRGHGHHDRRGPGRQDHLHGRGHVLSGMDGRHARLRHRDPDHRRAGRLRRR